ncbi:hypothetical protein BGZ91_008105, partial [Linnemannia elongata]
MCSYLKTPVLAPAPSLLARTIARTISSTATGAATRTNSSDPGKCTKDPIKNVHGHFHARSVQLSNEFLILDQIL